MRKTKFRTPKHTKGPWRVEKRTTPGQFVTDTLITSMDGSVLATVGPCDVDRNAALLAEAPELLAVAIRLLEEFELLVDYQEPYTTGGLPSRVRATIRRALGK